MARRVARQFVVWRTGNSMAIALEASRKMAANRPPDAALAQSAA